MIIQPVAGFKNASFFGDQSFKNKINRAADKSAIFSAIALLALVASGAFFTFGGICGCHGLFAAGVTSAIVSGVSALAAKHFSNQIEENLSKAPQALEMRDLGLGNIKE